MYVFIYAASTRCVTKFTVLTRNFMVETFQKAENYSTRAYKMYLIL